MPQEEVGHFKTKDSVVHLMVRKESTKYPILACGYLDDGGRLYGMYVGSDPVTCIDCQVAVQP